ncbi:hypothetical protein HDV00_012167 [Rhizophlyctis rosea]|nr:hypothetical protein HDV00_012167 [Rhizophlyctis rosea]
MAAYMPVPGSFITYAGLLVDPALSFTLGWNYWAQWAVSLPSELTALSIIMSFWTPQVPSWIWSALVLAILLGLNLIGARGFGEVEYWLAGIKVAAIIVFVLVGVAIDLGWIGGLPPFGFDLWSIPGAPFKNGAVGIFDVFVVAFFSFGGTELVGITAGEVKNPRENVPKAINQTIWRILLFFISTILIIGLLIRNDDPSLLNSAATDDITIAPFTLVFKRAGLRSAAHLMNGVILSAVLSAGNSAMYAASRTLMALGKEGRAPAWLGRVDGRGVPIASLGVTAGVGCLAFLGSLFGDGVVFTWLLRLTGISGILTWISIVFIHTRFRAAYRAQGQHLADLPYRAPFYPFGAFVAILLALAVFFGQGYAAMVKEGGSWKDVVLVYGMLTW